MKIIRIDIYKLDITLTQPTHIPLGVLDAAYNVVIKITSSSGDFGWGEASPFAPITGDSQASNYETAKTISHIIKGRNPLAIEMRMTEINAVTVAEPSIRSAFDMALYDLASKVAGLPLCLFLGGDLLMYNNTRQRELHTDLTIGLQNTIEETVSCAKKILGAGFGAIKLKVGRSGLDDVPHVSAVRELVGPDVSIKIDSNQGWTYQEAVANIEAMASLNLQYSEQPIAAWDTANLRRLREKVDLPICLDESVFDHHDALKLINAKAGDYLNIKLGKAGGIHTALKINAIAEAAGCRCMIGCFAESRLALSAAAHLALARPNIYFLDLDSAFKHEQDPVLGGMTYDAKVGGLLHLPDRPGHGAHFDESFFDPQFHITIE